MHCFRGHLSRGAELGAEAAAVPRCDRGNARSSECGSEDEPTDEQNTEQSRDRDASRASRSPPPNPRARGRISFVTSPNSLARRGLSVALSLTVCTDVYPIAQ